MPLDPENEAFPFLLNAFYNAVVRPSYHLHAGAETPIRLVVAAVHSSSSGTHDLREAASGRNLDPVMRCLSTRPRRMLLGIFDIRVDVLNQAPPKGQPEHLGAATYPQHRKPAVQRKLRQPELELVPSMVYFSQLGVSRLAVEAGIDVASSCEENAIEGVDSRKWGVRRELDRSCPLGFDRLSVSRSKTIGAPLSFRIGGARWQCDTNRGNCPTSRHQELNPEHSSKSR